MGDRRRFLKLLAAAGAGPGTDPRAGRRTRPRPLGRRGFGHERYIGWVALVGILSALLAPVVVRAVEGAVEAARAAGEPVAPAIIGALLTHWYLSLPLAVVALAVVLFGLGMAYFNYVLPLWERVTRWRSERGRLT